MAHATVEELGNFLEPDPLPANPGRLLDRATRDVNAEILTAVYDVGDNGRATDPKILDALRNATLEQAAYRVSAGDGGGAGAWSTVALGPANLTRRTDRTPPAEDTVGRLCVDAWQILQEAGLTGHGPQACG